MTGPRRPVVRRIVLGVAALLGVVGLALLLWARGGASTPVAEAEPPPVAAAPPAAATPGEPEPAPAPTDEEALPEAVRRYLARTVYPPSSGRLTAAHEDLLHPNRRHESRRLAPDSLGDDPSEAVSYLLTADRYRVEGGGALRPVLEVWRGEEPIPGEVTLLEAVAVREGRGGDEGEPVAVRFERRGDRLEAVVPLEPFAEHHGPIVVRVRFAWEGAPPSGGGSHDDQLRFFHTPTSHIPASLTRSFHDYVSEGSLRVDVGVAVDRPGFYRFDANVFGPDGRPVAYAAFKGELGPDDPFVPLEVYGKVLRDAGVAGPYEIRDLRGYRFLDGQYPDREQIATDADEAWTTEAYGLDEFTDEPWTSEHKQRVVELMLEDEERGIALEVPPEPTPGAEPGERPPDDDAEVELPAPDDGASG
jgi:hypothetical protein